MQQYFKFRVEAIQHSECKNSQITRNNAVRGLEEIVALTEAKDLLDARVRYSSGRVYHPLVNCPKEFRTAVVDEEGQPYVEIDLRSSQAVFLCKVIAITLIATRVFLKCYLETSKLTNNYSDLKLIWY